MADLTQNIPTWRYVRSLLPPIAAGVVGANIQLATFDDNRTRRLTGIFVSGGGALQHSKLDLAGRVFADVDHAMFAAARGPLELDQSFPSGVLFSVTPQVDAAGVAILASTVVVTLRYSSDPILSPAGSTS